MEVSERHTVGLLAAYRKEGPAAVAHGKQREEAGNDHVPGDTQTPGEGSSRPRAPTQGSIDIPRRSDKRVCLADAETGLDLRSRSTMRRILLAGAPAASPRDTPSLQALQAVDGSAISGWAPGPRCHRTCWCPVATTITPTCEMLAGVHMRRILLQRPRTRTPHRRRGRRHWRRSLSPSSDSRKMPTLHGAAGHALSTTRVPDSPFGFSKGSLQQTRSLQLGGDHASRCKASTSGAG